MEAGPDHVRPCQHYRKFQNFLLSVREVAAKRPLDSLDSSDRSRPLSPLAGAAPPAGVTMASPLLGKPPLGHREGRGGPAVSWAGFLLVTSRGCGELGQCSREFQVPSYPGWGGTAKEERTPSTSRPGPSAGLWEAHLRTPRNLSGVSEGRDRSEPLHCDLTVGRGLEGAPVSGLPAQGVGAGGSTSHQLCNLERASAPLPTLSCSWKMDRPRS